MKLSGVVLVLRNLKELRQGESIDQHLSYLERPLVTGTRGRHAPFEYSALLVGEIENRLVKCGRDGFILKVHVALEESEESIARALGLSREEVYRAIVSALQYISGKWPKNESYQVYKYRKTQILARENYHAKFMSRGSDYEEFKRR